MSKEDYLQMKKQARVWFTVNIIISLIAIAGGILVVISKSRHIPFLLMALGALTLMNQFLVTPAFNAKKEAEEEHPEWKSLSTKGTKITAENLQKGFWCQLWLFWLSLLVSSCSIVLFRQQTQELK